MDQNPEFWRTEVFHPLSVHFPIALLLTAFLFKLIALKFRSKTWVNGGSILLLLGVLGIWIAVYTGDLADGIVSRQLCDPTVLKDHENLAILTSWIFTGALIADILRYFKLSFFGKKLMTYLIAITMAVGSGYLAYVGHLGATLVYQQAAGVYTPSEDCAEFN